MVCLVYYGIANDDFDGRIAHRLRDMQRLPYVVVTNPHVSDVYELYYSAFDTLRRTREIKTLEDNERFCEQLGQLLRSHLGVIPKLTIGMLECSGLMPADELDKFMNTVLRSVCLHPPVFSWQ